MSKPGRTGSTFYTAKEVVEILTKARELNVLSIKLEGFEAAFSPLAKTTPAKPPRKPPQNQGQTEADRKCRYCGSSMTLGIQSGRFYCHPCYLARKEQKYQQTRQW